MIERRPATENKTSRSEADHPEINWPETSRAGNSHSSLDASFSYVCLGNDLLLLGTHFTATLPGSVLLTSGVVG
jgi:hypothetical protein